MYGWRENLSSKFQVYSIKSFISYSSNICCSALSRVRLFPSHGLQHARLPCPSRTPGVYLEIKKIKSVTVSFVSLYICYEVMVPNGIIFIFWMLSFKPDFSLSSFTFIKRLFNSSLLSAKRVMSSEFLSYWYFSRQSWFQLVINPAWHFTDVLCIWVK